MAKPAFTITAGELDAGGKAFVRPIPHVWLEAAFEESDATPIGDGHVDVRLSKSGTDVVVHGRVTASVELACSRCLEPVRVALKPEISVLMVPAAKVKRGETAEQEITANEADVLPYDGDTIALDDIMRDDLLLDLPMIPLCSDSCPGIASAREVLERDHQSVDPRLAPLLALKKQHKE